MAVDDKLSRFLPLNGGKRRESGHWIFPRIGAAPAALPPAHRSVLWHAPCFAQQRTTMWFIVGFLVMVAIIGALLYLLVIHREVPGAVEQRFGVLEPLPPDVGKWKVDDASDEGKAAGKQGLRREVRVFHDPNWGLSGAGALVRQVRYRNPTTSAIVRVDPDVFVRRRRRKRSPDQLH